jgi:signal transduction histidine kinase
MLSVALSATGSAQEARSASQFLGPAADHFLDGSGGLAIDTIAAEASGVSFTKADGRVPNYGVRPGAVLWLRVHVPKLDAAAAPTWVLSIDESRMRHVVLYLPSASGWSVREWDFDRPPAGASSVTRYPTLRATAGELSDRTIFLRIQTVSSLRALLWLQPEAVFINGYAGQSTWFGVLFGILAALLFYLAVIGGAMRDPALLALSAFIANYLVYVVADRGFIETVVAPGAATLSRLLSLPGAWLLFAAALAYTSIYLRVADYFPRLARVVWTYLGLLVLFAVEAGYAILTDTTRLRSLLPYFGLVALLLIAALPVVVMRRETGRSLAFLLCWVPTLIAGSARVMLDGFPAIGANPLMVNSQYFAATATLMALALLTAFDLQMRERSLRASAEASEIANKYKSRFLASASHDLRQPLHALNLFVSQLRTESDPTARGRLAARIEAAVGSMNELFDALLDMSKLDAGILEPSRSEFPVARLLQRIETTFADSARGRRLRLRVILSKAWVRSDFILLERMVMNLVSNAVRYTAQGGIVVGCRRRGGHLRIDVCDTGPGIPEDQHRSIFGEFYQLAGQRNRQVGLGLGLAIVDRLGRLLDHPVALTSRLGRGSRFSISVPLVAEPRAAEKASPLPAAGADPVRGKLVIVIDDDALVLDGMGGLLRSWGCTVVTGDSAEAVLPSIEVATRCPDLIISDYRLANGTTGIEAIARLREKLGAEIPAFLISGDTAPERLREASAGGFHLLHKPVSPMALRTTLDRSLII